MPVSPASCFSASFLISGYRSRRLSVSRARSPVDANMLQYDTVLKFALVPSIIFFLISLVSVALTTHYWIIGDWIVPRAVQIVTSEFNERLQQYVTDDTIVYFTDPDSDATIVSGCLNLTAAVVALVAWSTLRKPDINTQSSAGKRRFWVLSVVVTTTGGATMALASLILHFTERGNNQYGCRHERLMMSGKLNTNQYCTREMAACNFQPKFIPSADRSNASIACNEAVTVKWLQIVLMTNALIVLALFSTQARLRRKSREMQLKEPLPETI
ncbi:hypothetical protein BDW02DRAFT_575172 [Decorospora gaudefroyi]|uniref:MARVEL domain-containing protein n=1 Tax=Decorospora gaudefroyi TaxID=184978 RepID=A0A6A5K0X4_9PLEO|nr:hypothetical protein BDW02DRAFT_575172 [Decorospora gaudefroyi]